MPKVSIIVPCYNQGAYLEEAVGSVLDQTFQDFEILIVDDGSNDPETISMLEGYERPKTRVMRTDNQGLAAARNNGIREAKGQYILPLDADDKIGPGYLEDAVGILDRHYDIGIVYSEAAYFGIKGGRWDLPEYSLEEILNHNIIFCSALFRKADWETVGGYNINMIYGWEDWDFWLSLIHLGKKVYRIPKIHFYYRLREASMVHRMDEEKNFFMRFHTYLNHRDLYRQIAMIDIRWKFMELYIDTGLGFHNHQCIRQVVFADQSEVEFDLRGYRGIRGLRLDPVNSRVLLNINEIALAEPGGSRKFVSDYAHNALLKVAENLFFDTEDPQILIQKNLPGEIESLVFRFRFLSLGDEVLSDLLHLKDHTISKINAEKIQAESILHSVRAELHSRDQELEKLKEQLKQREDDISRIFHSRSWRITEPLRILSELFRGKPEQH